MAGKLIEIKGLATHIGNVKEGIAGLREAAATLNAESTGLKAELDDLTQQIKEHREDLRFEAETLGNSPPQSEPQEKTVEQESKKELSTTPPMPHAYGQQ